MKKLVFFVLLIPCFVFAQQQTATYSISPSPTFEGTDALTITVNGSSINEATWGVTNNQLYAWVWALNTANANIPFGGNGDWGNSNNSQLMTYNAVSDTYSFSYNPSVFTFFGSTEVAKVGFLIKAKNGNGDKKSQDIVLNVGSYQVTLLNDIIGGATQLFTTNYAIAARHTGSTANYVLKRDGAVINSQNNLNASTVAASYTYTDTETTNFNVYTLEVTQNGVTKSYTFSALKTIIPSSEALPAGLLDGINYSSDHTKATLVVTAPHKDLVYVLGNFNNWLPNANYVMKKDPATGKFWLELTGLVAEQWYGFQYWVCDNTAVPLNSPKIVKTADPYSTLVLSPFDDPEIISLGAYPGIPVYNTIAPNQEREVSIIQTGTNTFRSYNWSAASTNFVKPNIKDLVIYEVLVRDFDANRTYQDLINKIAYFKNLGINAIQLMPVMEFEGNESWGYNTAFHLALDKRYGSPAKLKEFVDLCHQNGIVVILDIALNHVFGRSPLVRMWMQDANGDGWGDSVQTTTENPYINQFARHSYSVGADINHFFEPNTQNTSNVTNTWGENLANTYTTRTIQHWINEYKIDGYRWDLTKGFTQNCTSGNETCTNAYQTDRVAKLKAYADKQWEADNTSICIFEHLGIGGSYTEEVEWANYKLIEGKGILQWRKMTDPYANLLKGSATNLSGVAESTNRFIGYAESHDEERIVYKALVEAGQTQNNLTKTLLRLRALGAVLFLVPGPKMIWHFGELGWNTSLWQCTNGTTSFSNPDCKLDTKPQPQWANNWLSDTNRSGVYNDWSRQIKLKINENVFENGQYTWDFSQTGRPRLNIWTSLTQTSNLSYVIVLTNFSDSNYTVGGFPFTGNWVNLMDNAVLNVTNTNQTITIEPGGYRVFGNQQPTLSTDQFEPSSEIELYPNPAKNSFSISKTANSIEIYNLTGQLVKSYKNIEINQSIDIESLQTGIYSVKIIENNGLSQTKRLIKE
jgi:1,4-alpha-glucan branching enzyme